MKRLLLLRHAKSSWDDAMLDDRERPLAPRGKRAAGQICGYLLQQDLSPALVLCSSARRTRETLAGLMPAIRTDATVRIEEQLYGADAESLLRRIRAVDDSVPSVLAIGHNPAMHDLARRLASGDARAAEIDAAYPAGALAIFEVEGEWSALDGSAAAVAEFVKPRDL
jgi:phosphohistidine phosphatase